jgi:hypothetical protein
MALQSNPTQPLGHKNYIKNVAIVGAGGNSGRPMAESLLATGKHVVTALTRTDSTTPLPAGVSVTRVDYNDQSSLVAALRGQDVLIITLSVTAPHDQESKLVEAAAAADVPWVLPNEWSPDMANESLSKDVFIGNAKAATRALISKLGVSSWIAVSTGFWYEWSLAIPLSYGFDFKNRSVTLFDEGETKICTSTWPQVGRAVASLLSLKITPDGEGDEKQCLERFKNGYVYVSSFTLSQKDMLNSVLRVTNTRLEEWKVIKEPVKERYAKGVEQMQKGDRMGFAKAMYARVFYPDDCGNVEKTRGLQNELLGLPKEDLDEFTKKAIARAEELERTGSVYRGRD